MTERTVKQLREDRQLWPQNLTFTELRSEYEKSIRDVPLSTRMILEEILDRLANKHHL